MAKPWYELIFEQSVDAKCQVDQMLRQIVDGEGHAEEGSGMYICLF